MFPSVDKMHLMLTELCSCYSVCSDLAVFDHTVVPTEFLISHLEIRLSEYDVWGGAHIQICFDLNCLMSPGCV